ncbi:MAG TPA: LuxR C-terminal-related transcriptional regulator [Bryobacteraceae bacterium]|nr:LuxR C-terminal-related transcriptional regulator [Bryobacteraceae bacterium]
MSPELSRLVISIYDAATNPELWDVFYREFSGIVQADFLGIQVHNLGQKQSRFLSSHGQTREFSKSYHEYYSRRNIWRDRGKQLFQPGAVVIASQHTPQNVLTRSEFYNDFLRPAGIGYSMVAIMNRGPEVITGLSVNRTEDRDDFDQNDLEITKLLLPHLSKAAEIQQRCAMFSAGEMLLNRLANGVIFLTGGGRVAFANRAAERLFGEGDGIVAEDGRLSARCPESEGALQRAIQNAVNPGLDAPFRSAFFVNRGSSRQPLQAIAFPLRGCARPFYGMPVPAMVLIVTDPERRCSVSGELLEELVGLSHSESRVARLLLEGYSTSEIAAELKIQENTVRAHLKAMFSKTTTRNQSELVAYLLTYGTDPAAG